MMSVWQAVAQPGLRVLGAGLWGQQRRGLEGQSITELLLQPVGLLQEAIGLSLSCSRSWEAL